MFNFFKCFKECHLFILRRLLIHIHDELLWELPKDQLKETYGNRTYFYYCLTLFTDAHHYAFGMIYYTQMRMNRNELKYYYCPTLALQMV